MKKKEKNEEKMENLQIDDSQIDRSQSSQESWWSSWSGLSQKFSDSPKGEKCNWAEFSSDEEKDKWCSSFKSKSSQKSSQESSCFSKKEKKDEEEEKQQTMENVEGATGGEDDEDVKVEFSLKVGKYKKFKFYGFFL